MAKQTITEITDDIDGSKDAREVSFSFDGTHYTIDLGKKNLTAFEKALKPYLELATKVTARSSGTRTARPARSTKAGSGRDLNKVREWARTNGIEVSERGRVAARVLDQYDAANDKSQSQRTPTS